jgi:hypothetical protein
MMKPVYVETRIDASLDLVWERTQDPRQHQRWDLRFTRIEHLPRESAEEPQRFRYAVRVPWREVLGDGLSAGERRRPDGQCTSALRFASADPLSLLADGSGCWRYVPTDDGLRFLTGYDYRVRWGAVGRAADEALFRRWMGWATAWSFDRLRIWCEHGVSPEQSRARALANAGVRATLVAAAVACGGPVLAVSVAVAAVLAPLPATVPGARRCRRTPSDAIGRRTPAVTAQLETG